jgi:hypothetical protein
MIRGLPSQFRVTGESSDEANRPAMVDSVQAAKWERGGKGLDSTECRRETVLAKQSIA